MAATTTNLRLFSPVYLAPSSTVNRRRLHGINKRSQTRIFFPAKPFPSLSIKIAASSSPSRPTCTPLTPLYPTTRPSTLTWSTRSSTELTRSLATLAALAIALARALACKLSLAAHTSALRLSLQTGGTVFLASLRERPPGYLITPQTVVAVVMKKWVDIYSDVLMLRLLLTWFPNLPWERQPLSAIRDMCDPYLSLFRNIVPPIFGEDLSPMLALAVLGTLGSILDVST
ncbi:unnamed protein product [Brassica rapa]|uniref:YGGT family protein n=1 Tax=Brassica campestris TaxID=3711 RepID=A0A3P6A0W5_BRACM|nr:unnamed protein product [Brassica rapa]VDC77878.1 unnamed protein product [Brassica rapa]